MTKRNNIALMQGITEAYINAAIKETVDTGVAQLPVTMIPYRLFYRHVLDEENGFDNALAHHGDNSVAIIDTVGAFQSGLPIKETFDMAEITNKPPFQFFTIEFETENGVLYMKNSHLLDNMSFHDFNDNYDHSVPQYRRLYFQNPTGMPNTAIIDSFGTVYFARESKKLLEDRYEALIERMAERVNDLLPRAPEGPKPLMG